MTDNILARDDEAIRELSSVLYKAAELNRNDHDIFGKAVRLWDYTLRRYAPGVEDLYMEEIKGVEKAAALELCKGFAILVKHFCIDGLFSDVLGPVYMECASRWKQAGLGQYFTPWEVCVCMAELVWSEYNPFEVMNPTVNEPCCGSGAMLLAIRGVVTKRQGKQVAKALRLSGQDIDPLCVHMTRVQVLLSDTEYMEAYWSASAPLLGE